MSSLYTAQRTVPVGLANSRGTVTYGKCRMSSAAGSYILSVRQWKLYFFLPFIAPEEKRRRTKYTIVLTCGNLQNANPRRPPQQLGIGNGTAIAIAFAIRYGDHPLYRSSLRSIVSINGFSSVDGQLAAILHSSANAFATLPANRPDLPVSFMSR